MVYCYCCGTVQGESLLPRVLCLKVMFLLASMLSCASFMIKCTLNVIFLWTAIDLQKYYDGKYAFYRLAVPLWTLGSVRRRLTRV